MLPAERSSRIAPPLALQPGASPSKSQQPDGNWKRFMKWLCNERVRGWWYGSMSRRKSSSHWSPPRLWGSRHWLCGAVPALGKGCSLPDLHHSRERPRLEEQGLLELNRIRIQFELGIIDDSAEAKLHLAAAPLQEAVCWFWVGLNHLQRGQGEITEQGPESQAELGAFGPPKSTTYRG